MAVKQEPIRQAPVMLALGSSMTEILRYDARGRDRPRATQPVLSPGYGNAWSSLQEFLVRPQNLRIDWRAARSHQNCHPPH